MGQKTNPTILRLGNIKQWKSKYIEKKSSESGLFNFYDLEIQKFVQKLLSDHDLILQNCQTHYLENSLYIYISYYVKEDSVASIRNNNSSNQLRTKRRKRFLTKQFRRRYFNLRKKTKNYFQFNDINRVFQNKKSFPKYNKKTLFKNIMHLMKKNNYSLKYTRNRFVSYYKLVSKSDGTIKEIETSLFWKKISKSIQIFLKKPLNIKLHFQQSTKPTISTFNNKHIKTLKKIIGQLRKYKQSKFFRPGLNLIFRFLTSNQSAKLLSVFIADELKRQKRHNFFLSFIKTTIKLLNQKKIMKTKGVKIKIKGRFNGAPRAKYRIISFSEGVPILTIKSNIDYSNTTAYTSNGTFGVKVWTFN